MSGPLQVYQYETAYGPTPLGQMGQTEAVAAPVVAGARVGALVFAVGAAALVGATNGYVGAIVRKRKAQRWEAAQDAAWGAAVIGGALGLIGWVLTR
jgi:Na+-driven multidrug efflux pump